MGGSSSSSDSKTTKITNTNTSNMALDGVEGLTLSNAEGNKINYNVTDGGAFETVNEAIKSAETTALSALSSLANSNTENLDQVGETTIASLEKINESNMSEQQAMLDKLSTVAVGGMVVFAAVSIWNNR